MAETGVVPKEAKIQSLQVLRGLAAIAVAFYHVYIILHEQTDRLIFPGLAGHGFLGVNLFFVISGFVIFTVHQKEFGDTSKIPSYLYKRFSRVYPIYWLYLTLFLIAAYLGLGFPDFSWDPVNLFSSYALFSFNDPVTFPLKVAWTLFYEIRFYLVFLAFFVSFRLGMAICAAWAVALVAAFLWKLQAPFDLLEPWNLYFLFGIAAALLVKRLPARIGPPILAVGLLVLVVYLIVFDIPEIAVLARQYPYLHFVLAPMFASILMGFILTERAYAIRFPKPLMFLGDASYSIYLVHSAVISVLSIVSKKFGIMSRIGEAPLFLIIFVVAVTVGAIAYVIVEVPLMKALRGKLPGRPVAVAT